MVATINRVAFITTIDQIATVVAVDFVDTPSTINDIIAAIAEMDADVITIETSRSDMSLLDVFDEFHYPNQIGPGVYDIHSPNIPSVESIVELMQKAEQRIPAERLWINPDCGLKTRTWEEVLPALQNMIEAKQQLVGQKINDKRSAIH